MHWEQIRDKWGRIPPLTLESREIRAASFTTSSRSQQQTNVTLNMLLEVCIQYIAQYFTAQLQLYYSLNALYVFSQMGA